MSTFWTYSLIDRDTEEELIGRTCDNLTQAIQHAFRSATYYLGHGHDVDCVFAEACEKCAGTGYIRPFSIYKWERCPLCEGKPVGQQFGPIHLRAADEHVEISLRQGVIS